MPGQPEYRVDDTVPRMNSAGRPAGHFSSLIAWFPQPAGRNEMRARPVVTCGSSVSPFDPNGRLGTEEMDIDHVTELLGRTELFHTLDEQVRRELAWVSWSAGPTARRPTWSSSICRDGWLASCWSWPRRQEGRAPRSWTRAGSPRRSWRTWSVAPGRR